MQLDFIKHDRRLLNPFVAAGTFYCECSTLKVLQFGLEVHSSFYNLGLSSALVSFNLKKVQSIELSKQDKLHSRILKLHRLRGCNLLVSHHCV